MSSRQRPSLKGRGSDIFFSEDETEDHDENAAESLAGNEEPDSTAVAERIEHEPDYSGEMKKLTFNLPLELDFALDEVQLSLRRATRSGVTKTEIVQAALERALEEFQRDGVESQLLEDLGVEAVRADAPQAGEAHN